MNLNNEFEKFQIFDSSNSCDLCNAQEGKLSRVGKYVVELTNVEFRNEVKKACQCCKIKYLNFKRAEDGDENETNIFIQLTKKFLYIN